MLRVLSIIESVLNTIIQLDARTTNRIESLNNIRCHIEIIDITTFDILFLNHRIKLLPPLSETIDTTIKGPLNAFLSLSITKDVREAAKQGLSVEGNMVAANHIQTLFFTLAIDWEELISRVTGDTIAHQMVSFLKKAKLKQQSLFESLSNSTRLYITEEIHLLPTVTELDQLINDIDHTRADVERLEAKISLLEKKWKSLVESSVEVI
jgi:ubiquinone biosynthesis protein UbiJ